MGRFDRKAQSERKHGPLSVSSASKAPVAPPSTRPEFRGPGYTRKKTAIKRQPAPRAQAPASKVTEQIIPNKLQQLILDVFQETFPSCNEFNSLKPALREIRDDLAQRDFKRAFSTEERMERYTIRWSPSQALAYSNILAWICTEWKDNEWVRRFYGDNNKTPSNVLCFNRGAAELVALIAVLKYLHLGSADQSNQSLPANEEGISNSVESLAISEMQPERNRALLDACLVDTANWTQVISKLHSSYTTSRRLSPYASAKARALNTPFIPSQALSWKFTQLDIFESGIEDLKGMIGLEPILLTFFFTLSDLYQTSIPKTSALLLKITAAAPKGSLLLVVDRPGACVETMVEKHENENKEKSYPLQWLLYWTLFPKETRKTETDKDKDTKEPAWEKLVEDDHCLFELEKGLRFPASLENIKYQIHLLQRL